MSRIQPPFEFTCCGRPSAPLCALAILLLAFPAAAGAKSDFLAPLNLPDVKVGGEIGRRIQVTIHNNLLQLDADHDFLRPFAEEPRRGQYIGLGKTLDATVKFAAYSGDARVLALRKHFLEETFKAQEADGYIGTFPPAKRIVTLWDVHEMGYLIWAWLQDYRYFGESASLTAARRAADYLVENWSRLPPDWGAASSTAPHVAFTGIERTMVALYQATADARYLEFCSKTRALNDWNLPIIIGRRRGIEGHVYAYLARCLAQLELYRIQPSPQLLAPSQRAVDFLTRQDGMLITGSAGQTEIWTADQDARGEAGETCALAYQLRVYDSLLRMNGNPRMGDLMERTIFNALFASQSPDGRHLRYYAPLEGKRSYWKTDTYCCPCNFRRIVAELPLMAFYQAPDGVAVNLYTPSQARLKLTPDRIVNLAQETDYPNSGRIRLRIAPEQPAQFTLRMRIPAWATNASVTLNGQPAPGPVLPGTFFELCREWRSGDHVDLDLPMSWRLVKGRQRQAGRVAVMRGPLAFCLNPAQNPTLATLDGADLGYLLLQPSSFGDPVPNTAVRPDGLGCQLQAWKPGTGLSQTPDYKLTLTEFPDPAGQATYFRLRDFDAAVEDELLSGGGKPAKSLTE